MSKSLKPPIPKRKSNNLEMANTMFKEAFLVKRTRFARENPHLSDVELDKMTADYFRNLPDDEGKRGWV